MAAPYYIWLRGSNTHFDSGSLTASQVLTGGSDSAPTTIAEPSEANGWLKVWVYALDPRPEKEGEKIRAIDGKEYSLHDVYWKFNFRTDTYDWDDDWADWKALLQHLSRDEVFFHSGTFDQAMQAPNTCLAVNVDFQAKYTHERGAMYLEATLSTRAPGEDL